jgi:hypothetical protein
LTRTRQANLFNSVVCFPFYRLGASYWLVNKKIKERIERQSATGQREGKGGKASNRRTCREI